MLRDRYARETDPAKQKQIAEAVQVRAIQVTTHVILGLWFFAVAVRKNVVGMPIAPVPVFWNVEDGHATNSWKCCATGTRAKRIRLGRSRLPRRFKCAPSTWTVDPYLNPGNSFRGMGRSRHLHNSK